MINNELITLAIFKNMKILSSLITIALTTIPISNMFAHQAISKPSQIPQCPNPFPSTYKSSSKTKYVKIPELGVSIRVPEDHRLIYIKKEKRFTFMAPPEYKSYQCSLANKVDYSSFYRQPYYYGYTVIENPKKQSLSTILKETYKDTISIEKLGKLRLNNIDFLTTPIDQGDPTTGWFTPKSKPGIIVKYSVFCDCGSTYSDLTNDLSDIKNIFE
jgi:hypothetical protein